MPQPQALEIFVNLHWMALITGMHTRQDIGLDGVFLQVCQTIQRGLQRRFTASVDTESIVKMGGTINGNPHEELMFAKEFAPAIV